MQITGCEDFQTVHQELVMVLVLDPIAVRERIRTLLGLEDAAEIQTVDV